MSRRIWGIALTAAAFLILVTAGFLYYRHDAVIPPEEQSGTEFVEEPSAHWTAEQEEEPSADLMTVEAAAEGYQFVLVDDDNYVSVYQLPSGEIYEYTDVIMDVLPSELQEEIRSGKYLKNEEELYNFLENYTS